MNCGAGGRYKWRVLRSVEEREGRAKSGEENMYLGCVVKISGEGVCCRNVVREQKVLWRCDVIGGYNLYCGGYEMEL